MRKADRTALKDQNSQALSVSVAGERVAIPANDIAEVIRNPAVTRIPHSPPGLLGVTNLRGTVIPVVSLAALLGRPSATPMSRRVVVVRSSLPVGLTVDEVASLDSAARLRSGDDPIRFLDVEALVSAHFGTLSKPETKGGASVTAKTAPDAASAVPEEVFFSFEVAGQLFALPLASVHEVLSIPAEIAVVPRTDDAMLGAVTLRNRLIPLVSLATLLGLAEDNVSAGKIVLAAIRGVRVGLVVDGLKAIVRATSDQIDPVPLVLTRGRQEAHIQAICRLDEGRRLMSILSTDHLLDDALAERLAAQRHNEDEDMADGTVHAETEQFVIFQLGDEYYGLPISSVVEVVAPPDKLTRLPKAPKFVEGVMNLRGQVVPVIDQRRRFEAPAGRGKKSRIVVVRIGNALAGFVVDGVSEVLKVDPGQLRPAPELASRKSKVIDRIATFEHEGRMILLVDPQELLDQAEQDLIAAMHGTASAPS